MTSLRHSASWIEVGWVFIHHRSAARSLKELRRYFEL